MISLSTISELNEHLNPLRLKGLSIGFVPTMGALHRGHIELMLRAKQENPIVVVSIFVNPTQFNNPNDLRNYPRTLEQDLIKCQEAGVSYVFAPDVKEIYPVPDTRQFNFGLLDKVMEGKHRPGHFNGVAQVVSKLFDIVEPDKAYFGQKDFQQLAVIRKMVGDLSYKVEIIGCPTVREDDGLAMSSRNVLLNPHQRESAPLIAKTLMAARNKKDRFNVKDTISWVIEEINSNSELRVEYFEIANAETLESVSDWNDANDLVGCIAVQVGDVRLIDNILF
ncbi:MAG: pantoate--beta-alanine ligase [Bacteroidetes bacterium HGW-Bacteroidetes-15]|nr:MAG: pantoate--beta-alanine ligase [Bacteroidetes bacterium HGW-Bacteroidetes-15]